MDFDHFFGEARYGAKGSFMSEMDVAPSSFALYSPLEPLFGGELLGSPDLLLAPELETTPALSMDLDLTRSPTLSPLLASPVEQPDLPLFMLPKMKLPLLQPQLDIDLAPVDNAFALDLEPETPSRAGPQRQKRKPPAKKRSAKQQSVEEEPVEGETEEQARRRKAREAQRKCRAKRLAHIENLEFQAAALQSERERLQARADALRAAIAKQKMARA